MSNVKDQGIETMSSLWSWYLQVRATATKEAALLALEKFLMQFLIMRKQNEAVAHFCYDMSTVGNILVREFMSDMHVCCRIDSAAPDDVRPLHNYLFRGRGWKLLAVLSYIGVQSLPCTQELSIILISLLPVCLKLLSHPCKNIQGSDDQWASVDLFFEELLILLASTKDKRKQSTADSMPSRRNRPERKSHAKSSRFLLQKEIQETDGKLTLSEQEESKLNLVRPSMSVEILEEDIDKNCSPLDLWLIMIVILQKLCLSDSNQGHSGWSLSSSVLPQIVTILKFDLFTKSQGEQMILDKVTIWEHTVRLILMLMLSIGTHQEGQEVITNCSVINVLLKHCFDARNLLTETQNLLIKRQILLFIYTVIYGLILCFNQVMGSLYDKLKFFYAIQLMSTFMQNQGNDLFIFVVSELERVSLFPEKLLNLVYCTGKLLELSNKNKSIYAHIIECTKHRHRKCDLNNLKYHHNNVCGKAFLDNILTSTSDISDNMNAENVTSLCCIASLSVMLIKTFSQSSVSKIQLCILKLFEKSGLCCCLPLDILLNNLLMNLQNISIGLWNKIFPLVENFFLHQLWFSQSNDYSICSTCQRKWGSSKTDNGSSSSLVENYWLPLQIYVDLLCKNDKTLIIQVAEHLLRFSNSSNKILKQELFSFVFLPLYQSLPKDSAKLFAENNFLLELSLQTCLHGLSLLLTDKHSCKIFRESGDWSNLVHLMCIPSLRQSALAVIFNLMIYSDLKMLEGNSDAFLEFIHGLFRYTFTEFLKRRGQKFTSATPMPESSSESAKSAEIQPLIKKLHRYFCIEFMSDLSYTCNLLISQSNTFHVKFQDSGGGQLAYQVLELILHTAFSSFTSITEEQLVLPQNEQRVFKMSLHVISSLLAICLQLCPIILTNGKIITIDDLLSVLWMYLIGFKTASVANISLLLETLLSSAKQDVKVVLPYKHVIGIFDSAHYDLEDSELQEFMESDDEQNGSSGYDADTELCDYKTENGKIIRIKQIKEDNNEIILYPKIYVLMFELISYQNYEKSYPRIVAVILQKLKTVCKNSQHNCEMLRHQNLPQVLLKCFTPVFFLNDVKYKGLQQVVLDLFVAMSLYGISSEDLKSFLRLFNEANPQFMHSLLLAHLDLERQMPVQPSYAVVFPSALKNSDHLEGIDLLGQHHRQISLNSAWSCAAMQLKILHGLTWPPYRSGFALCCWLFICEDLVGMKEGGVSFPGNSMHLFSVGSDMLLFEVWWKITDGGILSFKLSQSTVRSYTLLAEGELKQVIEGSRWHHITISYSEQPVGAKHFGQVMVIINSCCQRCLHLEYTPPAIKVKENPHIFIGHSWEVITRKDLIQISSLVLFNDWALINKELGFHLYSLGVDANPASLQDPAMMQKFYVPYISPELMASSLSQDLLTGARRLPLNEIKESLILWYSARNKNIFCLQSPSAPSENKSLSLGSLLSGKLWKPSEPASISAMINSCEAITLAYINQLTIHHLDLAIHKLGGVQIYLTLLAKVVEICSAEVVQAQAMRLLFKIIHRNYEKYKQYQDMKGSQLVAKILTNKRCIFGPIMLETLLSAALSSSVVEYSCARSCYEVKKKTDTVIRDISIICDLLLNRKILNHTSKSVQHLIFLSLVSLVREGHPYQQFNVKILQSHSVVEKLIYMLQECFIDSEVVLSSSACGLVTEFVNCMLGSPLQVNIIVAIFDFLLLTHPSDSTFVCHSSGSSFFILPFRESSKFKEFNKKRLTKTDQLISSQNRFEKSIQNNKNINKKGKLLCKDSSVNEIDDNHLEGREALSEGLLKVLCNVVATSPDSMLSQIIETIIKPEALIVLAYHKCYKISIQVIKLLSMYFHRARIEQFRSFLKIRGFYLLGNQFLQQLATKEIVETCLSAICGKPFFFSESENEPIHEISKVQMHFIIPLFSLLKRSVHDIVLCHNLLQVLMKLYQYDAGLQLLMMEHHLIEVLCSIFVDIILTSASISDLFGVNEKDLICQDLQSFFILIIHSIVVKSGMIPYFLDLIIMLGYTYKQISDLDGISSHDKLAVRCTLYLCLKVAIITCTQTVDMKQSSALLRDIALQDMSTMHQIKYHALKKDDQYEKFLVDTQWMSLMDSSALEEVAGKFRQVIQIATNIILQSQAHPLLNRTQENLLSEEIIFICYLLSLLVNGLNCFLVSSSEELLKTPTPMIWTLKDLFKSELPRLLVHMLSPIHPIELRMSPVFLLNKISQCREILAICISTEIQVEHKLAAYLENLINSPELEMNEKKKVEDLFNVLESVSALATSLRKQIATKDEMLGLQNEDEEVRKELIHLQEEQETRIKNNLKTMENSISESAMTVTREVSTQIFGERRNCLEQIKISNALQVKIDHQWRKIIQNLTHERALWYNSEFYPRSWQLDPTEGPFRVRKRLQRCYLRIEKRFFKEEAKHKAIVPFGSEKWFLSYLFNEDESSQQSASVIARLYISDNIRMNVGCKIITPGNETAGEVLIGDKNLYFVGEESMLSPGQYQKEGTISLLWPFVDIREILKRRFQLKENALEIFLHNGRTYLLAFSEDKYREEIYLQLLNLLPSSKTSENVELIMQQWQQGHMTNYEYLIQLNKMAGRTFNDLMQYPVFPFILSEYNTEMLDLYDPKSFRDLSRPISVQDDTKKQHFVDQYNYLQTELKKEKREDLMPNKAPYHYSSHYSNTGTVLHFLTRLPPFTEMFLAYQDQNFDLPDRTFHSMETTWRLSSSESTTDVKELIPEFFYLPEFLINSERFDLGVRQNGIEVDHVNLPLWCHNDARLYVLIHRQALESNFVTRNLHLWIDLIFGYKQTGKGAVEAVNVFHPVTYYGFSMTGKEDDISRLALETMVKTYGQTPKQLFKTSHPPVLIKNDVLPESVTGFPGVIGLKWGQFVGSCAESKPEVLDTFTYSSSIASIVAIPPIGVFGLGIHSTLFINSYKEKGSSSQTDAALIRWSPIDNIVRIKTKKQQPSIPIINQHAMEKITCCATGLVSDHLFIGSNAGIITVYRLGKQSGKLHDFGIIKPADYLYGHDGAITSIQVCSNFSIVVSGSADTNCIIWDLNKLIYVRTISAHHNPISLLAISNTAGDIASVSHTESGSMLYLHSLNAEEVKKPISSYINIHSICFSNAPEGISVNVIAAGLANGMIRLWNTWNLDPVYDFPARFNSPIVSITYGLDLMYLFVADQDGHVIIWESKRKMSLPRRPVFVALV